MLIPGKPHSRGKSRNSWVSIKTLDFARVSTRRDGSWIASRGTKGGSPTGPRRCSRPMPGPHRCLQTIDSRRLRVQNVAKRPVGRATEVARPGTRSGRSVPDAGPGNHRAPPLCRAPLDNRLTSWADGCTRNGGPRPGVRTIGRYLSALSCSLYRQTEVAAFALPGRCSGVTRVISARHLPLLPPTT